MGYKSVRNQWMDEQGDCRSFRDFEALPSDDQMKPRITFWLFPIDLYPPLPLHYLLQQCFLKIRKPFEVDCVISHTDKKLLSKNLSCSVFLSNNFLHQVECRAFCYQVKHFLCPETPLVPQKYFLASCYVQSSYKYPSTNKGLFRYIWVYSRCQTIFKLRVHHVTEPCLPLNPPIWYSRLYAAFGCWTQVQIRPELGHLSYLPP